MPTILSDIAMYIRRVASPTLRSAPEPYAAVIVVDSTTDTLKFHSGGEKEVMDLSNTQTITGTKTFTGTTAVRAPVVVTAEATYAITAAQSGTMFVCTRSSLTQVFTLPLAATAGLEYTFVCAHADGEIRLAVGTGDNIIGKTHGAENGTGILTTASTGLLLNTAAGNVVGDFVTVRSDGLTTYYMRSVAGAWSAA